jgi:hypothetical protein
VRPANVNPVVRFVRHDQGYQTGMAQYAGRHGGQDRDRARRHQCKSVNRMSQVLEDTIIRNQQTANNCTGWT